MSADTFQQSVFELGSLRDGSWFCACNKPAKWLTTTSGAHKGQKFLRCQSSPQCRFFLWEKDEASARVSVASRRLSNPQTPTRRPENQVAFPPTPNSRDMAHTTSGTAISRGVISADDSPIPFRINTLAQRPYGTSDLTEKILTLLRSNKVDMSASTQSLLRHIISTEVAVYETRLQKAEETILELGKQLGVLQREPIDTRPSGVASIDGSRIQFGTMG